MSDQTDPIDPQLIPRLAPYSGARPGLPAVFTCEALLHPFAPPPQNDPKNTPFYQLCTASITSACDTYFLAKVQGLEYGQWWYFVTASGTQLSTDEGQSWQPVDSGWAPTTTDPIGDSARCAGAGPLNWMSDREMSWWSSPVKVEGSEALGATWMWFDTKTGFLSRVMFGVQPKTPTTGTADQLPLLQNFSFSYLTNFQSYSEDPLGITDVADVPSAEATPIPGLAPGNPRDLPLWDWAPNQGFTVLMTPVNQKYDPLPTRVLYRWDPDPFTSTSVRSQSTLMRYPNAIPPENYSYQLALLQRQPAPARNYDAFYDQAGDIVEPASSQPFPFDTQPPNWVQLGDGDIKATIQDNPELCPNTLVTVGAVMFPPAKNYPQGTYLWTWYSPVEGTLSRPIVFMQSASALGKGTSLALADYYYFTTFDDPIDEANFQLPQHIDVPG